MSGKNVCAARRRSSSSSMQFGRRKQADSNSQRKPDTAPPITASIDRSCTKSLPLPTNERTNDRSIGSGIDRSNAPPQGMAVPIVSGRRNSGKPRKNHARTQPKKHEKSNPPHPTEKHRKHDNYNDNDDDNITAVRCWRLLWHSYRT